MAELSTALPIWPTANSQLNALLQTQHSQNTDMLCTLDRLSEMNKTILRDKQALQFLTDVHAASETYVYQSKPWGDHVRLTGQKAFNK